MFISRKQVTKKVCNDKINLIKLKNRTYTKFMNSGNSKTPGPDRLSLNLSDKMNLKRRINLLLYQALAFTIHWKI